MDEVREILVNNILQIDVLSFISRRKCAEVIADKILQEMEEICTDITPKKDYPKTCAYCSRPAESRYG